MNKKLEESQRKVTDSRRLRNGMWYAPPDSLDTFSTYISFLHLVSLNRYRRSGRRIDYRMHAQIRADLQLHNFLHLRDNSAY